MRCSPQNASCAPLALRRERRLRENRRLRFSSGRPDRMVRGCWHRKRSGLIAVRLEEQARGCDAEDMLVGKCEGLAYRMWSRIQTWAEIGLSPLPRGNSRKQVRQQPPQQQSQMLIRDVGQRWLPRNGKISSRTLRGEIVLLACATPFAFGPSLPAAECCSSTRRVASDEVGYKVIIKWDDDEIVFMTRKGNLPPTAKTSSHGAGLGVRRSFEARCL